MTQSVKVLRLTQMQSAQRLRLTQIPPIWKQKKRLKVVLIAVAPPRVLLTRLAATMMMMGLVTVAIVL
jgi:hypothetical protein